MYNLPAVELSGVELSDLFFNEVQEREYSIEDEAEKFLVKYPSFKKQGITVRILVKDYQERL